MAPHATRFTFLLIIGGLSSIPVEMYEASSIDGATGWKQFKNIALPRLRPTLLVASVMANISALQIFDQLYVKAAAVLSRSRRIHALEACSLPAGSGTGSAETVPGLRSGANLRAGQITVNILSCEVFT